MPRCLYNIMCQVLCAVFNLTASPSLKLARKTGGQNPRSLIPPEDDGGNVELLKVKSYGCMLFTLTNPHVVPLVQIDFDTACNSYYCSVFVEIPTYLVMTDMIRTILDTIKSPQTKTPVWIEGGKGTGKSSCYFALQKKLGKPLLLASIYMTDQSQFLKYYCKGT